MKIKNAILLMIAIASMTILLACAKKDLIVDVGEGDSIRLVGASDNFECDDPAYAEVEKIVTWTMQFEDGSTKRLCAPKESRTAIKSAPPAPTHRAVSSPVPNYNGQPVQPGMPYPAPVIVK